jgi:hypothetical protein
MTATIHQPTSRSLQAKPQSWPCDRIALAATYTALTCTSLLVHHTLGTWRLRSVSRQVEAVALQLVTNAVAATGTMDEHLNLKHVDYLNIIVVGLRQTENAVVVEVWDSSSEPPTAPAPVGHQSGYFMFSGGKVVWTAVAYPLPRRKAAPFTYPPPAEFSEPSQYSNDENTVQRARIALQDG